MKSTYTLLVRRTIVDEVATYSECELWRKSEANQRGVCLFRKNGIENTKLRMAVGSYPARFTKSPRFTKQATEKARKLDPKAPEVAVFTWEIFGVMDGTRLRAGLRIHPVNFARDLLGCLAFGMELSDLNGDDVMDLARSREAHRLFDQAAQGAEEITVVITDPEVAT